MIGQEIQIKHFDNGAWCFTLKNGGQYQVSSINQFCTEKLQKLNEKNEGKAYITLEPITEYYSHEYRCKVSAIPDTGWHDNDVYCLVTNETGNLNPNAEQDITAATETLKTIRGIQ